MLSYFLVRPQRDDLTVSIVGEQTPESRDFTVPGDISSAAFWLVAAAAQPRSHLLVKDVGLNETRTGCWRYYCVWERTCVKLSRKWTKASRTDRWKSRGTP